MERFVYRFDVSDQIKKDSFATVFSKVIDEYSVISIVGAGGKTTLLYELAQLAASLEKQTIVMTSTHIFRPENALYAQTMDQVRLLWQKGKYAVIGKTVEHEKITMPEDSLFEQSLQEADLVLIEADGSKHMPLKVPGEHEPVILPETKLVVGVMGMDALHQTLESSCFRLEAVKDFLKKEEREYITIDDFCSIALSDKGLQKDVQGRTFCLVFNKYDLLEKIEDGLELMKSIKEKADIPIYMLGREK